MKDMTTDQARTKDLERRGFHNAEVRSDGLRAVVELGHVGDVDRLLLDHDGGGWRLCPRCSDLEAELGEQVEKNEDLQIELGGLEGDLQVLAKQFGAPNWKAFVEILNDRDALALLIGTRD